MIKRFLKNVASVLMLVSFAAVAQAAALPKAEVSKLPALTLSAGNYSVWNGSLTEGKVDRQLQVVMNFKTMETAEEARPNGYLMHKCDFYLTFTGIKDESKKLMAKDCFLAGNYGDFGWIVIPTDDVEIEEGVQYPVVAGYDANITYKQICESVKNFTAAIHVAPAILEANPDFKVKLELRMTNPDNADDYFTVGEPAIYTADELKNGSGELPDATVSKLSALTLAPNSYSTYDGSLHKNDEKTTSDRPLQIVMNFKANDTEETAKARGFDKYLCDFYLKFTGLKEGKITADNCYLAGNYGDFGWIVIPADGLELEEGVEYPVVSGYDATLNYKDICKSVKDFTAAIHVAPAILEANPDFKVSLALRMTHPENKAYFNVGAPIVYSVADLKPVAKVVVSKAEDVKINGEAPVASDLAEVEKIIKEFSLNNDLTVGDNGIVDADNSDEVAAARSALVAAGVAEAQASAAVPSVAVTFTEIKKNDEGKIVQMVFDVTPAVAVGDKSVKISSFSSDITFRLPVYSENSGNAAKIYHDGVFAGVYAIKGEGANKYVEVASKTFSTYTVEPIAVEGVARIGETGYATLEAAYTAAQAGDTVTLLNNVAVNNNDAYGLMIEKAITIDGNGKTITVADGYANTYALMYLYAISGKVTIKNLTFDGVKSGAAIWAHDADVEIDNCVFQNGEHTQVQGLVRTTCANLTVKNSQFKNNNCNFAITFNYDAAESDTMLVENCDFVGNTVNDTAIVYYVDGASSTIKDCKFVDNTVKSASHGAVVYYSNGANGSLTGNVFSGNKITAGGVRASVLALEAGTTASENAFVGNICVSTASGTTYVGTVLNKADADSAGVAISGNYWGGSEPDCVSTKGAPVVLENYYTTYESGVLGGLEAIVANVAKIGTTGYATLLQAFAAAKSGAKVELLSDLTLQAGDIDYYQNIKIPAGVTFDGGNYELVVMESQDSDYAVIWSDGAYTVQNLSIKVMGRREANRSVFNFSKGGKLSNVKIWAQVLDIGVNYDKPVDGMEFIVENCEISNVIYAFYCDPNASDIDVTIKDSIINSQRFGSMQHDEKIEGNTLTSTCTKGISLGASFTGTVTGNTFAGARALSVYGTQTISGNAFGSSSIIELNNGAVADLSGNYWGGEAPAEGRIVADKATSVVSFTVDNYYTTYDSGVLGGLVTIASNVAEVNGVQYADLQEAINAANGGTVTLLADVTYTTVYADNKSHWNGDLNYELSIGGNVTLDLNGNAIKTTGGSSHSYYALICVRSGSLTVVDSSEAKTGAIVCSAETIAQRAYTIYNNGALVLNGGTISNTVGNYAVESVTVGATALTVNEGATVISTGIAVRVCSQGSGGTQTVRINGGTINGTYAMWVPIKNGGRDIIDMEINGGTFTGSSNAILFNTYSSADYSTDSIAIKGGVFNGAVLIGSQYATDANNTALSTALTGKVVSGGKFSNDVSDYVAGGYMLVQNEGGTYGVAVDPAYGKVAKIGETYYETIKAALDAVQEDETIQLLAGTIEEGSILFPAVLKNITIKGAADKQTVVKNTTFGSFHGGSVHYEGITIDGIVFDGSQIVFTGARTGEVVYKNWTISNCEFRNIVSASNSAIHFNLAADETLEGLTFVNNVIDGVTGGNISGLRANYLSGDIVIVGNRISNVAWNAIQLIHANVGTYTIENNVLASGAAEGILNLYNTTATTLSIANNQFLVTEGQAGIGYLGSGDVSANYWGGEAPANLPEGVTFVNYYTTVAEDGTLGGLMTCVAQIGNVKYATLQDAIAAVQVGETITLIGNIDYVNVASAADSTTSINVPAGKKFTLDLNGYTISGENDANKSFAFMTVCVGADITIEDTSAEKTGKITYKSTRETPNENHEGYTIRNKGSLTLNGGTIENSSSLADNGYERAVTTAIDNCNYSGVASSFTMNGGVVVSETYFAIRYNVYEANTSVAKSAIMELNAGTVYGLHFCDWGSKNLDYQITVGENVVVECGRYPGLTDQSVRAAIASASTSKIAIDISEEADVKGVIYGIAAKIGSKYYTNIQKAFDAVQDGETITLLKNASLSAEVVISKSITIDGNGFMITPKDASYSGLAAFTIGNSGTQLGSQSVTFTNATFANFTTSYGVLRVEGATANVIDCVFEGNTQTSANRSIVNYNHAAGTISGCRFENNICGKVIDINSQIDDAAAANEVFVIDGNTFSGNKCTETAVIYYNVGSGSEIKNNTFADNMVETASHGAILYYSDGANCYVTGNVFSGNTIKAESARAGILALEAGTTASGNVFSDNNVSSTASGTTYVATVLNKADAGTSGVNVTGNYWGGSEPDCVSVKGASTTLDTYYTTYVNGVLGGLERLAKGSVAYRAYVTNNDSRNAVQIDLENLYAKESVVVKLLDADDNVLTVTTLKAGGVEAETYTVNAVLWGNPSSSWDTEIKQTLTVDNAPATIELWLDGKLCDTFENAMGDKMNDYLAMGCIYKAAAIGTKYYGSLASAVAAAQDGETVVVISELADVTVDVAKDITISGSVTLNNVGINANGATELSVIGLNFTGDSWINVGTATKLTVSGVTANVTPRNATYTNSRSAFISLGRSEQHNLELTVENCNIVSNGGSDPILGWAKIAKATITGSTFGSASAYQSNSDSIKFMSIAEGAEILIVGNKFYSNYNGIVFAQNTTRENSYTAVIDDNEFFGGADHVWIEISGGDVCHAAINATSSNTVNGNPMVAADIKAHTGVIKTWSSYAGVDVVVNDEGKVVGGVMAFYGADAIADGYEVAANGEVVPGPVALIGDVTYATLEAAAAAAKAGDTIVLVSDATLAADLTLPADISLDGNGKQINGTIYAGGNLTFAGHTKVTNFNAGGNKPTITIGVGACLELTGTGRMVIGHGATFNIEGAIADAKTADVGEVQPSLIAAGASFTGTGVNFNVTNAYVKFTAYCSSKNSSANDTFNINVNNSVWKQTNSLVFSEPTNGKDPTFNFKVVDSVLDSTSHLVFGVSKGEIVFDNSDVNVGAARQLENRSTLTIKNGAVVYAAHATSSNAKNPGTTIVNNATYIATGEFSGADVGVGSLVLKNGASVTMGNITKANVIVDSRSVLVANEIKMSGKLESAGDITAKITDAGGEFEISGGTYTQDVQPWCVEGCEAVDNTDGTWTVLPYVAMVGDEKFTSLAAAIEAAGEKLVTLLGDVDESVVLPNNDIRIYANGFTVGSVVDSSGHIVEKVNGAYQAGVNPEVPEIRSIKIVGDKVQLSFVPRQTLKTVVVESSSDLKTWTAMDGVTYVDDGPGKECVISVAKPQGNNAFFRVKFEYAD